MPRPQRVLVFTDSRGEHKASFGPKQKIYTEALADRFNADVVACPFKWTTFIDFILCCQRGYIDLTTYDRVILHLGIVDASPRPLSSLQKLLSGTDEIKRSRLFVRPNSGRPRIHNNKLALVSKLIPDYHEHLRTHLNTAYCGEKTQMFLTPHMFQEKILPWLRSHVGDRLILINMNRISRGWEGNYLKRNPHGRPKNIHRIEEHTALLSSSGIPMVDPGVWSDSEVRRYTVDNMHLTPEGSAWILQRLIPLLSEPVSGHSELPQA